jgi:hypothetical protein
LAFAINDNDINRVGCALLSIHVAAHSEVVNNVVVFVEVKVEVALLSTTVAFTATIFCVGLYTTNNQNSTAISLHSSQ